MDKSLLLELCDNLNIRGGSVLAVPIPELFELLEELFTEEEAKVARKMPVQATSLKDLSAILSRPEDETAPLLESMADKATVATREKDGVVLYKLLPLAPGMFEFQFMRGTDTEKDRRLARLFKAYNEAPQVLAKKPATPKDVTPFMRVIPVEETLKTGRKVYTFEELSNYIDTADAISVGHCYCRHEAYLLGEEVCDGPEYRCMSFGPGARYTAERGIARLISREEAHEILKECQDAGLVHMGSNTTKFLEFLCNCCSCHCGTLKNIDEMGRPIWTAPSGYYASVDESACEACETCVDICPMDAISMNEKDFAEVDPSHCIGCGVCANQCPDDAIIMELREEIPSPPETPRDLRMAILKDYQRALAEEK